MKDIVIFGAGGHAHVIADIVKAEGNRVIAYLDDDLNQEDSTGPILDYAKFTNCEFIIGIGDASTREKIAVLNLKWHTAIHPSAVVSDSAVLGQGTVVMPNSVINHGARIGHHCIINTAAVVEHDDVIDDFAHISVGAKLGGSVNIGKKSWIGIGATVNNNTSVGDSCVVGAGAVVVNDIMEKGVYVGIPARKL